MSTRPNTQSELIAELSDPELLGALLNSVSSSYKRKSHCCNIQSKVAKVTGDQTMLGTAR